MRFSYTPYLVCFWFLLALCSQNLQAQLLPYFYSYDQDSLVQAVSDARSPASRLKAACMAALHCLRLEECQLEESDQLLRQARAQSEYVADSILPWLKVSEAYRGYHLADLSDGEKRDSVLAMFEFAFAEAAKFQNTAVFRWAMYGLRFIHIDQDMVEADIGVLQKYSAPFADWNPVPVLDQMHVFYDMGIGYSEIALLSKSEAAFQKAYQLGYDAEDLHTHYFALKALVEYSTLAEDQALMQKAIKEIEKILETELDKQLRWEYTAYLAKLCAYAGQAVEAKAYWALTRALRKEVEYPDLAYAQIIESIFDAEILNKLGEYAQSEFLLTQALAKIDTSTFLAQRIRLYEYLMEAQAQQGKYRAQSENFQIFNRLQKQRAELQLQQKILNSEREYKAQIRLQQIARLEQEKELLARQRMFIGIGLGLTALLLGLVFWLLSQAQKRNKMLSAEKQKVETQSHKLREIEQSKNHFFINIAHELRTPLTLIKGPIKHLLKQKNLSQGTEKLLQIIDSQSENMHEQLDQILYLDHPKKEETNYHFQRFQIGELMDSLLPSFYAMAEMQGIDFSLESDDFSAFSLDVEKAKLQTILKNLLSNAFKFTAKGGEVVLRLRKKADTLVISVIDNGRGIPTQSLPYIFERFYQVPTEYQEGGSGIGLAICKRYVDSLRGTINVKSKAGAGSQFMVEIPVDWFGHSGAFIASESVASSPQIPPDRSKAETENLPLILVVEDQLAMGEFLRIILEKEYQVQLSPNGKEALSFLEKGLLPQLIITDFMMPEMDGKALVQALRKHQIWRSIPVIVLTARNELSEKLSFLRIGVDDYLGKPFLEEELLARIDNLIDNYHQRASFQQLALTPAESAVANSEEDDYDTRWVEKLVKVLQPMISDVDLTLDQVADKMAVSVTHLHRKVKAITGMTAMQFIQDQRFEEAKRQLENNRNISIKAVSYSVGFKSEKNFSRNFRKRYGVLPSVYRMS